MSSAAGGSGVGAGGGAAGGKPPAELWESVKEKGTEIGSGVLKRAQSIKVPREPPPPCLLLTWTLRGMILWRCHTPDSFVRSPLPQLSWSPH